MNRRENLYDHDFSGSKPFFISWGQIEVVLIGVVFISYIAFLLINNTYIK